MANYSNRNTSSNTIPVHMSTTCPKFKAGDAVLCPFLGYGAKRFILHKYEYHTELFCIHAHHSSIAFDSNGYFITAGDAQRGDIETNDYAPSLFIDTPENRQYIAGLYGAGMVPAIIHKTETNEVITLPAITVSDIACNVWGASQALNDLTMLLALISKGELKTSQVTALARMSQDTSNSWCEVLRGLLDTLNEPLACSAFGTVGGE